MKLFQINEDDLQTLEQIVPGLCDRLQSLDFAANGPKHQNELKTKIRQVRRILTDVRWNYGPPEIIEQIPADGGDDVPPPN